jgi:hypothetical protein
VGGRVRDRAPAGIRPTAGRSARPVLLATLDVPLTDEACALAVDTAVETGQPLLVVNVVAASFFSLVPNAPMVDPIVRPDVEASLRSPAQLGASLGVRVERLRIVTPRRVEALVELAAERAPGLLVFGADPGRLRRRTYDRALARLQERTTCLVWPA